MNTQEHKELIYNNAVKVWRICGATPDADIWALGDSYTTGQNSVEQHETWPAQLANILGQPVNNLGITTQSLEHLIELYQITLEKHGEPKHTCIVLPGIDNGFYKIHRGHVYHLGGFVLERLTDEKLAILNLSKTDVLRAQRSAGKTYNKNIKKLLDINTNKTILVRENLTDYIDKSILDHKDVILYRHRLDNGTDNVHIGPITHEQWAYQFAYQFRLSFKQKAL